MVPFVDLKAQYQNIKDEIDKAVSDCISESNFIRGKAVGKFEKDFADYLGVEFCSGCANGTDAIEIILASLNIGSGDEVLVPALTWIATAEAVNNVGAEPVFVDVDPATMNITAETIKAKLTDKTKAIMVMHYAGLPVEMDAIKALGLPIIEDAAQAVASTYKGTPCGTIGDVGIYSFDAVKNIAVGEGGGLTSPDPEKMARARRLRYCGIEKSGFEASAHGKQRWWEYNISEAFIKMLPSDITAGIGLGQLERLPENQARRKQVWDTYQQAFADVSWLTRPQEAPSGSVHSYFTYCIRTSHGKRDDMAHALLDQGIYTTVRYHPLHLNPLYGQTDVSLPVSEALNEDSLCLPLHPAPCTRHGPLYQKAPPGACS